MGPNARPNRKHKTNFITFAFMSNSSQLTQLIIQMHTVTFVSSYIELFWILDRGLWIRSPGLSIPDPGSWSHDSGS